MVNALIVTQRRPWFQIVTGPFTVKKEFNHWSENVAVKWSNRSWANMVGADKVPVNEGSGELWFPTIRTNKIISSGGHSFCYQCPRDAGVNSLAESQRGASAFPAGLLSTWIDRRLRPSTTRHHCWLRAVASDSAGPLKAARSVCMVDRRRP